MSKAGRVIQSYGEKDRQDSPQILDASSDVLLPELLRVSNALEHTYSRIRRRGDDVQVVCVLYRMSVRLKRGLKKVVEDLDHCLVSEGLPSFSREETNLVFLDIKFQQFFQLN